MLGSSVNSEAVLRMMRGGGMGAAAAPGSARGGRGGTRGGRSGTVCMVTALARASTKAMPADACPNRNP